jgi:SAM-dependent methyltransferase
MPRHHRVVTAALDTITRINAKIFDVGISYCDATMFWNARQRGVSFDRLLTVGHQCLFLHGREVAFFRREYQKAFGSSVTPLDHYRWGEYADTFLRDFLGASSVTVLDASQYEGADTIHDMNTPIPESWHDRYDAVIDSGSLEHIFNVPVALANLADMLKVGGTIFLTTPANNLMGHGFYQFSPELMFRVFSEPNGFDLRQIQMFEARYPSVELTKNHTLYDVVDPEQVRARVGLVSKRPVMMMVEATKMCDTHMFATAPLQSDYVAMWEPRGGERTMSSLERALRRSLGAVPIGVRAPIRGYREKRDFSFGNKAFYTRRRLPR